MSREIKFRAWSKSENKMYYRVLVGNTLTDDPCSVVWQDEQKEWVNFDKYCGVIMQYTDLKDKNGKDVFEGDIVESFHYGRTRQAVIIKWSAEKIGFTEFRMHRIGYDEYELHTDISVIGNIYENPELLEEVRHEY